MERIDLKPNDADLSAEVDIDTLMARIRQQVRGTASASSEALPETGQQPKATATDTDADFSQLVVRALDVMARDLQQTHLHAALVERWLRDETEQQAFDNQRTYAQLAQLSARVDDVDRRLASLESQLVEGLDAVRRSARVCENPPTPRATPYRRAAASPSLLAAVRLRARREGR